MNISKYLSLRKICILILLGTMVLFLIRIVEIGKSYIVKSEIAEIISKRGNEMSRFYVNDGYTNANGYIAHGGGIGHFVYTNCLEAVQDSIQRKFNFIEIDMIVSSDGLIVAAHDWQKLKKLASYNENSSKPLESNKIREFKINNKYTPIFGKDINKIMQNNDFVLVTDKIKDYDLLLKEIPYPDRMIVEVFSPERYLKALKAGVKYPAYCIWNKSDYAIAKEYKFPIVTMSGEMFKDDESIELVQKMHDSGVTILLFGPHVKGKRDDKLFVRKYLGKTVSKVYVDSIGPSDL